MTTSGDLGSISHHDIITVILKLSLFLCYQKSLCVHSLPSDRKANRQPTAAPTAAKKPVSSGDASRKPGAQGYPGKTAAKPTGGERKRPPSPTAPRGQPPAKVPARSSAPSAKPAVVAAVAKAAPAAAKPAGGAAAKKNTTVSRREELLKQLRAVEDAIARKKAKLK